jgi:hypothetical protein
MILKERDVCIRSISTGRNDFSIYELCVLSPCFHFTDWTCFRPVALQILTNRPAVRSEARVWSATMSRGQQPAAVQRGVASIGKAAESHDLTAKSNRLPDKSGIAAACGVIARVAGRNPNS